MCFPAAGRSLFKCRQQHRVRRLLGMLSKRPKAAPVPNAHALWLCALFVCVSRAVVTVAFGLTPYRTARYG